jgi:hypothetical protein
MSGEVLPLNVQISVLSMLPLNNSNFYINLGLSGELCEATPDRPAVCYCSGKRFSFRPTTVSSGIQKVLQAHIRAFPGSDI